MQISASCSKKRQTQRVCKENQFQIKERNEQGKSISSYRWGQRCLKLLHMCVVLHVCSSFDKALKNVAMNIFKCFTRTSHKARQEQSEIAGRKAKSHWKSPTLKETKLVSVHKSLLSTFVSLQSVLGWNRSSASSASAYLHSTEFMCFQLPKC